MHSRYGSIRIKITENIKIKDDWDGYKIMAKIMEISRGIVCVSHVNPKLCHYTKCGWKSVLARVKNPKLKDVYPIQNSIKKN